MMKISSPAAQVVSAAPSYAARSTTNSNVRSCCVRRVDGPLAEQAKLDAFGAASIVRDDPVAQPPGYCRSGGWRGIWADRVDWFAQVNDDIRQLAGDSAVTYA